MVFCSHCAVEVEVEVDDANGFSCCIQCGRVLEDVAFSADVTFQKDAAGESAVVGQFVNESGVARGIGRIHGGRVYAYQADSHEKAQQRGRQDIVQLVDQLGVRPREDSVEAAHRYYKLALQRGFTRGRRTSQVAAACLYLFCRQEGKPFLLIDFSDALQVNVFTLGAVFLQLAKLLRLDDHPTFCKPVDPSLYIHRFADRLDFGDNHTMRKVADTAMRLVASMKRDWIQTGRRPSGVCGAALYIAAHIHGFRRTKKDVVAVVHIGEHTLARRLYEFSATRASDLTAAEFEEHAKAIDNSQVAALEASKPQERPAGMLGFGCEHMRLGDPHFAHDMCRACYIAFCQSTGGMADDGSNPPAFDRARRAEEQEQLAITAGGEEKEEGDGEQEEGEDGREQLQGEDSSSQQEGDEVEEDMASALESRELQAFVALLPSAARAEGMPRARTGRGRARGGAKGRAALNSLAAAAAAATDAQERSEQAAADAPAAEPPASEAPLTEAEAASAAPEGEAVPAEGTQVASQQAVGTQVGSQQVEGTQVGSQDMAGGAAADKATGQPGQAEQAEGRSSKRARIEPHQQLDGSSQAPAAGAGSQAGPSSESALAQQGSGTQASAAGGRTAAEEAMLQQAREEEEADGQRGGRPEAQSQQDERREGGEGQQQEKGQAGEEEEEEGTLSDINDSDIEMYLADEAEVKCKEEIWNMMNREWVEKQAAKKAALEAAERAQAEQRAAMEAANAAGVAFKRSRGRPLGSRSKQQKEQADLPPAENAQEAALRMLDNRRLSSKINYNVLADLFSDKPAEPAAVGGGAGGAGGAEDGKGPGAAVSAAFRKRKEQESRKEARKKAKQEEALREEKASLERQGGAAAGWGLGGGTSSGRLGSLSGAPRAGRIGSLKDKPSWSNMRGGGSGALGGSSLRGSGQLKGAKKTVRFSPGLGDE